MIMDATQLANCCLSTDTFYLLFIYFQVEHNQNIIQIVVGQLREVVTWGIKASMANYVVFVMDNLKARVYFF